MEKAQRLFKAPAADVFLSECVNAKVLFQTCRLFGWHSLFLCIQTSSDLFFKWFIRFVGVWMDQIIMAVCRRVGEDAQKMRAIHIRLSDAEQISEIIHIWIERFTHSIQRFCWHFKRFSKQPVYNIYSIWIEKQDLRSYRSTKVKKRCHPYQLDCYLFLQNCSRL